MILPASFGKYRGEINAELKQVLGGRQSPLYDMMRYHLGWIDEKGNPLRDSTGKALRPTLCLLACEVAGGDYRRALPAAAAIELVHNFSLIHDDIQDDDTERRHQPTVWSIWGKPQAINAGTAMRLLSNVALLRLNQYDISLEKRLRAQCLIDETSLNLIEGQYLDINYETRFDITVADYLDMIEKKTAMLLACSLETGALLGTDDECLISRLRSIGLNLGLAFQIVDDVLGIWGDEETTGKPQGNDIRRRKKTFPIVCILEETSDGFREELIRIYRNGTGDSVAEVLQILESIDARSRAKKMAERYCDEAIKEINCLSVPSSAKQALEEIACFLVRRNF